MKTLNNILYFCFFTTLVLFANISVNCTATSTEASSQNQIKGSAVLELMNQAFASKSHKKNHLNKHAKNRVMSQKMKAAPAAEEEIGKAKYIEEVDRMRLQTEFEKLKVVQEGWFKVASLKFKDLDIFPGVTMPNYMTKNVRFDLDNFRINELFDENKAPAAGGPTTESSFYFRISDKNIYYTATKDSLNILGSIPLKRILGVIKDKSYESACFNIQDQDNSNWRLCAPTKPERKAFFCHFQKILGVEDNTCKVVLGANDGFVVEDQNVTDPVILIPLPSKTCNDNWNYDTQGKDWNCDCAEGKLQAPIDIDANKVTRSPVKPVFRYGKTTVDYKADMGEESPIKMEYAENSVKIKHENLGKLITLDGNVYAATEIIFHTPSQHTINGRYYDLEVEIVHQGESKDVISNHAIVSILFTSKPGVYNRFFDEIDFFNLPNPLFKKRDIKRDFNLNNIFYEIQQTDYPMWKPFSFYTYEGSLTAPPCTQKTIHYVKSAPIEIGNTTIQLFKEALRVPDTMDVDGNVTMTTHEPKNVRDTQPLNGRKVYYYDNVINSAIKGQVDKEESPKGHYEKVTQDMVNYYHVTGPKPSGLPGAFMVSEREAKGQ
jgi:carbonic anhydrase